MRQTQGREQKFRKLTVWHKAMSVMSEVYEVTGKFPKDELYGLTSQLRRAAVSIAMNIAEGSGADSDAEFKRFLTMASKSVCEVMCGLEVAANLTYLSRELTDRLLDHLEEFGRVVSHAPRACQEAES